ncbi:MAG TPA: helix-turn-helix transcriptional regulator [Amycolatopsis sp.]|uniref:helix-turn-helix domain-containing protein n=1 Tax=Amycolatopsis sp. TaxID=37632 RepID=UPI002B45CE04|nr:helix-turn-helix transcriptional regulator [Amycolatopsis sp.]HKS45604.1 helix-turn-helix transcriptional regulator [Amycolatopsis sp.]
MVQPDSDPGAVLRHARESAGVSLSHMASLTYFSKPYLGFIETGRKPVTPEVLTAYETALGGPVVAEGEDMWRKEIKHPRLHAVRGPKAIGELAASIAAGDPSPLTDKASAHWTDVSLAARADNGAAKNLRRWMVDGKTSTLRTNALSVVAKLPGRENADLVVTVLENDEKVRELCLASVVSRMLQLDWEGAKQVARDPSIAPNPKRLARAMAKEAVNPKDTESRWCGAYMLRELAPVLAR